MEGSSQVVPKRQLDKIFLVGDSGIGKSHLIFKYLSIINKTDIWEDRVCTEKLQFRVKDAEIEVMLEALQPTGCFGLGYGSTVYDQWKYYRHTSVVVLCFNVMHTWAEREITERWGPELWYFFRREKWLDDSAKGLEYVKEGRLWDERNEEDIRKDCLRDGRKVRFLLVGCQVDRRMEGDEAITFEQGKELVEEIGAENYLECSAETGEGVQEVFQEAARLALLWADSEVESMPDLEVEPRAKVKRGWRKRFRGYLSRTRRVSPSWWRPCG